MAAEKTAATRMVEGLIGGFLGSALDSATKDRPLPQLSANGEPITARSMLERLDLTIDGDPKTAMRIALILAAYIARQHGVTEKEALLSAAAAWAQTSQLT